VAGRRPGSPKGTPGHTLRRGPAREGWAQQERGWAQQERGREEGGAGEGGEVGRAPVRAGAGVRASGRAWSGRWGAGGVREGLAEHLLPGVMPPLA